LQSKDIHGQSRESTREAGDRRRWLVAGMGFPLVIAAAAYISSINPALPPTPASVDLTPRLQAMAVPVPAPEAALPAAEEVQPPPDSIEVTVQRNDTMDRIFRGAGIDIATLAELRSLPDARKSLDLLRPGDIIRLTHLNGVLQSLNRQISNTLTLSISRAEDGYAVNYIENPLEVQVVQNRARIESSLFEAGLDAGISPEVIMTLANQVFSWDIDFALDIRKGDEFSVLYERTFQDGEYVGDGRVLAAEFVNQGKAHRAIWFESEDGKVQGYYTPEGRSMRKAFLRAPLDFTRVSSSFNPRRRHPISGKVRAHNGVDYAAATGTPIKAAGDGRVIFAGRKGGYGNAVILQHRNGVTTLYGHMSRFNKSARSGRSVKQGQTIGYVGMTGAATGPHLHYEYRVNGVYKNPAKIKLPNVEIPSVYMAEFQSKAETVLARLGIAEGGDQQSFASR
jgi:murein DD-endopeptidase MepM/ murein hydrolase activator NlpD